MKYNPKINHRRSIRLKGYDYSRPGAYFITICTQNRNCLFGDIVSGGMRLNDAGKMVQTSWDEIPAHYPGIGIDLCVVMPNHFHGIVTIVGAGPRACPAQPISPSSENSPCDTNSPKSQQPGSNGGFQSTRGAEKTGAIPVGYQNVLSLSDIVHRFKTLTTKRYSDGVKQMGWRPFPGRLWQRNFWEHVIRDDSNFSAIREYIQNNPALWESDSLHPMSEKIKHDS